MASLKEIGRNIKGVREQAGIRQVDLAKAAGITQATLSSIENGNDTTVGTLISLARALDKDLWELTKTGSDKRGEIQPSEALEIIANFINNNAKQK